MNVHSLHIYPVKSCRGIALKKMSVLAEGPAGDREWMLVDEKGTFLSQRTVGRMAQVETVLDENHLTLAFGGRFFKVSRQINKLRPHKVKVWSTELEAHDEPLLYSEAISQFLGVKCFLVRYTTDSKRLVKSKVDGFEPETRFTDRKPMHLVNLKSIEELNSRLENPIGASRFRANIVYQGTEPFEEDSWKRIQIGSVIFSQPSKCGRCKIITLDDKTGEGHGPEPLKTLSTYRKDGLNKVNFGNLWTPENTGEISLTDSIQVLS